MLKNQDGQEVSIQDYLSGKMTAGKKPAFIVLYFYPKDNTPGCTQEACEFRDITADLIKLNTLVLGVSADKIESHQRFIANHQLLFELLSDQDLTLSKEFGVWGKKNFMGKAYMGINRQTFILDSSGKVVKSWLKVKPAGHGSEVLEVITELSNQSM